MSSQPPKKTILAQLTQAVARTKVNFTRLALKPNARVPKLLVQDADAPQPDIFPLLGEKYVLGRSSQSCDIVVRNEVVSQVHLSLSRDRKKGTTFLLKDEGSTNGIYRGKKRVDRITLRDGDTFTLGPPELKAAVKITYLDPPPVYLKVLRYGLYGTGGLLSLILLGVLAESTKIDVDPLPDANGPVMVYAEDMEEPLRPAKTGAHKDLANVSDFSPHLPKALIASEDSRFYWHFGIDPWGVGRAIVVGRQKGKLTQGASTLTQQVARSLFRSYVGREDNLARKMREAVVALKLEATYSKDKILLTYLNRVFLGDDANGFEDASQHYLGKSARDLTLPEAAMLVGILPGPNMFNPCIEDKQGRKGTKAIERRNLVLGRMLETGVITQAEAREARRSTLNYRQEACTPTTNTKAPYVYSYVFQELQEILGTETAKEGNFAIETGLDLNMQAKAEAALRRNVANAGGSYRFSQGGIVTLDSTTGIVKAMVGGIDYQKSQFNRAVLAQRQPGSTFKLFGYAAAIAGGISPGKTYSCDPLSWGGRRFPACNHGAAGAVNMYTGFTLSENPIALRVARDIGLPKVIETAQKMGIKSKLDEVPALVLGQSVVNVLEITGAYNAVADRGIWRRPRVIKRVYDTSNCDLKQIRSCRVMYDATKDIQSQRVLSAEVADTLTTMMRSVVTSGTGKNAAIGLGEAGKTGTTDDNVDLWFIGFIPDKKVTTGVWLGNDDNSPTKGSSAQAAQLWGNYMGSVYK
ncbi:transglycosylase domain-containing protein [Chamaesiphon minutus]|uniref:Membrane carboxypeptidase (Penicillin-binding protein) n=1 Tax=Chamaesiphon minutus (strain ATCC 27169 / PCC 6605) TaxID=1173020 RepID=K9UBW1_CHAP6|nr:transglycosylase domain-containing protein [Chamaesiphon minutus]AFY91916.1 membrane carboxypeptidase (penicillin-binding protein) [Chamaesiphon minutus PCC 6605]